MSMAPQNKTTGPRDSIEEAALELNIDFDLTETAGQNQPPEAGSPASDQENSQQQKDQKEGHGHAAFSPLDILCRQVRKRKSISYLCVSPWSCPQAAGNQTVEEMQAKTEIDLELNATAADLEANLPAGIPPGRPGGWGEEDTYSFLLAIGLIKIAENCKKARLDGIGIMVLRDHECYSLGMNKEDIKK